MAQQLSSHPPGPGHNSIEVLQGVSQDEFLRWIDDMRGLDEQVAAAVDRRKAFLADIKQRIGKDEFASFKSVRKDAEMPGESRERRELSRRQMMRWLNKPVGHQAAMDFDAEEDRAPTAIDLRQIDGQGLTAGKAGKRRDTNPWTPGTAESARWDESWMRGQAALAATLSTNGDAHEEPQPKRRGRPRGSVNKPPSTRVDDEREDASEQVH